MGYIDEIRRKAGSPEKVDTLTESMMWEEHGPLVWQADHFEGSPTFYPVYRWGNYYSFSILALIVKKGNIKIDQKVLEKAAQDRFEELYSSEIVDEDIVRIGGAAISDQSVADPEEYVEKIKCALCSDIKAVESKNPNFTNLILCGGKDSLNLLLLPWKNPVVALSAFPNYELVKKFVKNNGLSIKVTRLEDIEDQEALKNETLECCCRIDMVHWRWGIHLKKIADEYDKKAIFWKGQFGDNLLTPYWKEYVFPKTRRNIYTGKLYRKMSFLIPDAIKYRIGEKILKGAYVRAWYIFAQRQGAHMGFIRSICDVLALSAYHGAEMTELYKKVNLAKAVQKDIRRMLGKAIAGRDLWYPSENPGPAISKFRQGYNHPEKFMAELKKGGIEIC